MPHESALANWKGGFAVADGLIDLQHVGGPAHLMEGIEAVDLAPETFFSFVRKGHPAAENWSAETASSFRYLQVAVEDSGSPFSAGR